MRRRIHIPDKVRAAIERHVRSRLTEVQHRFWSAAEDEDTFTGHLGGLLGRSERQVIVNGQAWHWGIDYTKFRGKGHKATESIVGADGIFEIRVHGVEIEGQKSLLFQAKMGYPIGTDALEQALIMSNWREASVFLGYDESEIRVYPIDAVLRGQIVASRSRGTAFADFFIRTFLGCKVGDSDLRYDPRARILEWRDEKRHRVGVQFSIPRRIRLSVKSPHRGRKSFSLVSAEEIGEHRMDSTAEERLGLDGQFSLKQLTQAKREMLGTFAVYERGPGVSTRIPKLPYIVFIGAIVCLGILVHTKSDADAAPKITCKLLDDWDARRHGKSGAQKWDKTVPSANFIENAINTLFGGCVGSPPIASFIDRWVIDINTVNCSLALVLRGYLLNGR